MNIKLNGLMQEVKSSNLKDFVKEKSLIEEGLILVKNGEVVKKENWENCILIENDELDVLSLVAGG